MELKQRDVFHFKSLLNSKLEIFCKCGKKEKQKPKKQNKRKVWENVIAAKSV